MPINHEPTKDWSKPQAPDHVGRVILVRKRWCDRNWSDTLDYTDFRHTEVTEALVYLGRRGKKWFDSEERDLPLAERFEYVDCTNLFAFRSSHVRVPVVDADFYADRDMFEDLVLWLDLQDEQAREADRARIAREQKDREIAAEKARNQPVVGKPMKVIKGRKVAPGTVGTVAFISGSSALLKPDNAWRDRKANGVWVPFAYLAAR